jgi:hypothetical protein
MRLDQVLMDRPLLVQMSRGFSDFFVASSFFYSNNCSCSVLAKPPAFASTLREQIFDLKNEDAI